MGKLRFADAVDHLAELEARAESFLEHALALKGEMHPVRCTKRRRLQVTMLHWTILATFAVLLALWNQLVPRKPKPKVN